MQIRFHTSLDAIAAADWNALRPDDNPFVSHEFLAGLEQHGCIRAQLGWQPHHLSLHDGLRLVAAMPLYLKGNSHGEFVFDWSWAQAYAHHGQHYYPKLLAAVPYSPVTGPRLLCGSTDPAPLQATLLQALVAHCSEHGLSSAHVNFLPPAQHTLFDASLWLARSDWQFHWQHQGYRDFADFLDALMPKKRKNLRQERARVAAQDVEMSTLHGDEMSADDWAFVDACYRATFEEKGNHPALTLDFFHHLGAKLPRNVVVFLARRHGQRVAMALCLRSSTTLYGRYWGFRDSIPGLHFEACYYQGIDYCIRHGLQRFEPGAQGEHKLARGFLPQSTQSFHFIADPRFRSAIRDSLYMEAQHLHAYGEALRCQSPYASRPAHSPAATPA